MAMTLSLQDMMRTLCQLPDLAFNSGLMPQLTLLVAGLLLVLLVAIDTRGRYRAICKLGELALLTSAVTAAAGLYAVLDQGFAISKSTSLLVVTPLSLLFCTVIPLLSLACLATSVRWLKHQDLAKGELVLLVLFANLGMQLMVSANHFLMLYLGLELQALSFYVLAAFARDNRQSAEAGLKYFLLGSLASGFLLFGIAMLYGASGTLDFAAVAQYLNSGGLTLLDQAALLFVLAGMAFKLAAVPFHLWTPDVYDGAPTPVTMLFATAGKLASVALLIVVLHGPLRPLMGQWQPLLAVLALASLIIGALGALRQERLKRLLGFSAIAQAGYMLLGLVIGLDALPALLLFVGVYAVASVGAFTVLLAFVKQGADGAIAPINTIADLRGLAANHPAWAAGFALFMLSLAGIPPLAGFWSKLYLLLAAFAHGHLLLTLTALLATVIGSFYYLKVAKAVYIDPIAEHQLPLRRDASAAAVIVALLSVLLTVGLMLGLTPTMKFLTNVVHASF
jgi:NADH-quinone oxidoreductase subunit N